MVGTYNNLGNLNAQQGNMKAALDYYFKALKINEKYDNKPWVANNYNNIGLVFAEQKDFRKSLEYHQKCISVREELGDSTGKGTNLNNIGLVYKDLGIYDSALYFFNYSLKLIDTNNVYEYANALNNIGLVHFEKGEFEDALKYYKEAQNKRVMLGNKESMAASLINIGSVLIELGRFKEALKYNSEGLALSDEIGVKIWIKNAHLNLSQNYEALGDFKTSLKHHKQFTKFKDSLFNDTRTKDRVTAEMEYQFDKEKDILKLEQEKKIEIEREQKEKQFLVLVFFISGTAIVIIFLLIIYRRLQITKKQKLVIEEQKEEVETQRDLIEGQKYEIEKKHTEIQESISYAKRIQEAILPPSTLLNKHLPHSFVLYKPKDVVAGDFYWLEDHDNIVFFAVADCTGHGVPGAMVSVVCHNALNRAVREFSLRDTGQILDKVRELVLITFEKSEEQMKDGMDICLCAWNKKTNMLQYSGANNPLYVVRDNELETIKGTKQPIGHIDNVISFEKHEVDLNSVHSIYLTTDGFADQFGGEYNKKFGLKNLRELLFKHHAKPVEEQKAILDSTLDRWIEQGNDDQIDDVCIVGVTFKV